MTSWTDKLNRRSVLVGGIALGVTSTVGVPGRDVQEPSMLSAAKDPFVPLPVPPQAEVTEGIARVNGTKLWYWDTGGRGPAIVLLHASTGSGLSWGYQQPVFAGAGYRVIGYSRRSRFGSDPAVAENPGAASEDLRALLDFLGVRTAHLVATAAGGSTGTAFAFDYPHRVSSFTNFGNTFSVREGPIYEVTQRIRPENWDDIAVEVRELGPSYRAANPVGTAAWLALTAKAYTGTVSQQERRITTEQLRTLRVPTLIMSGGADLATPPAISRLLHKLIPKSELRVVDESGHSLFWERPLVANRMVLKFISRHQPRRTPKGR